VQLRNMNVGRTDFALSTVMSTYSLENVAKFTYLGTTLSNQNDIDDDIKSRLNSGNAWY
jgi:hypothetical protein